MLADLYNLNLWMFIVVGVFGFLLCFFRYKFVWWVIPIVVLVCILFIVKVGESGINISFGTLTWFRVFLSMLFAIVLPIVGALSDFKKRHPRQTSLP